MFLRANRHLFDISRAAHTHVYVYVHAGERLGTTAQQQLTLYQQRRLALEMTDRGAARLQHSQPATVGDDRRREQLHFSVKDRNQRTIESSSLYGPRKLCSLLAWRECMCVIVTDTNTTLAEYATAHAHA